MGRPKVKTERATRVPVSGLRDIMTVFNKDPNYEYRWVVDSGEDGSKIMRFKNGGWEFARSEGDDRDVTVGQEAVYTSDSQGSLVRLMSGDNAYSYLMRISKDWYKADQKAKADEINEQEQTIKRTGTADGEDFSQYGSFKSSKIKDA